MEALLVALIILAMCIGWVMYRRRQRALEQRQAAAAHIDVDASGPVFLEPGIATSSEPSSPASPSSQQSVTDIIISNMPDTTTTTSPQTVTSAASDSQSVVEKVATIDEQEAMNRLLEYTEQIRNFQTMVSPNEIDTADLFPSEPADILNTNDNELDRYTQDEDVVPEQNQEKFKLLLSLAETEFNALRSTETGRALLQKEFPSV